MARLARIVRTVVKLAEKVLDDPQPEPVKLGDGGYDDRVYVGLVALREATTDTTVETVDRVATTPRLQAALGLDGKLAGSPAPSTVCEAANRLTTTIWRTMLAITTTLFSLSGVCAIDASGFGGVAAGPGNRPGTGRPLRPAWTSVRCTRPKITAFLPDE